MRLQAWGVDFIGLVFYKQRERQQSFLVFSEDRSREVTVEKVVLYTLAGSVFQKRFVGFGIRIRGFQVRETMYFAFEFRVAVFRQVVFGLQDVILYIFVFSKDVRFELRFIFRLVTRFVKNSSVGTVVFFRRILAGDQEFSFSMTRYKVFVRKQVISFVVVFIIFMFIN